MIALDFLSSVAGLSHSPGLLHCCVGLCEQLQMIGTLVLAPRSWQLARTCLQKGGRRIIADLLSMISFALSDVSDFLHRFACAELLQCICAEEWTLAQS